MKKTLIALFALAACAQADQVLLDVDFSSDQFRGQTDALVLHGNNTIGAWTVVNCSANAGAVGSLEFNDNGVYHTNHADSEGQTGDNWAALKLTTTVNLIPTETYTIRYTIDGNSRIGNSQMGFFLATDAPQTGAPQYLVATINDYNNWMCIVDKTSTETDYTKAFFQQQLKDTEMGSTNQLTLGNVLDFELTLSNGALTVSVTDGSKTFTKDVEIAANQTFTTAGFLFDGQFNENGLDVGVKSLSITGPEPTTTTLSLLALAGLATRRRRH